MMQGLPDLERDGGRAGNLKVPGFPKSRSDAGERIAPEVETRAHIGEHYHSYLLPCNSSAILD